MSATTTHDCGALEGSAPPMHCIDPAAHHGYVKQPQPIGGNLTGAQLEDQSAMLARRFNGIGVVADPGRMGGVVLYPTGAQAGVILGALESVGAVVPAREVGDDA